VIFKEQRVLNFFLRKQIVATMRNGKYGLCIGELIDVKDGDGNLVGKARVKAVFENEDVFRRLLVKYSGFSTVEEWERTAKSLNGGKLPKFIVLLRFIGTKNVEAEVVKMMDVVVQAEDSSGCTHVD